MQTDASVHVLFIGIRENVPASLFFRQKGNFMRFRPFMFPIFFIISRV